uniref:Transmembrane protein 200B n=1 Tax=Fundulus heteroclitus TaxID=8078 RepID=A0A3Q2QN11_FUNHE
MGLESRAMLPAYSHPAGLVTRLLECYWRTATGGAPPLCLLGRKLHIRSMPGAFLVLGVIVVAFGTALAVAGYWPYHTKGLFSTASLLNCDRMKLLGPVIMGVGLFILICAFTVLYENRDRETQILLAQMRNAICSVSAAVPSAGDPATPGMPAQDCGRGLLFSSVRGRRGFHSASVRGRRGLRSALVRGR